MYFFIYSLCSNRNNYCLLFLHECMDFDYTSLWKIKRIVNNLELTKEQKIRKRTFHWILLWDSFNLFYALILWIQTFFKVHRLIPHYSADHPDLLSFFLIVHLLMCSLANTDIARKPPNENNDCIYYTFKWNLLSKIVHCQPTSLDVFTSSSRLIALADIFPNSLSIVEDSSWINTYKYAHH